MALQQEEIGFTRVSNRAKLDLTNQPSDAAGVMYITEKGLFPKEEVPICEILAGVSAKLADQLNNNGHEQLIADTLQRFDPVIPFLEKTAAAAVQDFSAEMFGLAGLFGTDATQIALHSAAIAVIGVLSKNEELDTLIRKKMDVRQRYAYIVAMKTALRIRAFADALNGHCDFIDDYMITAVPNWKQMTERGEIVINIDGEDQVNL